MSLASCFRNKWFLAAFVLVFIKITLAFLFPVIGDEAYYFVWGDYFAGGYYDLSPMIGWWEAFFTRFSHHPFWLRLPNLIVIALVCFSMYEWLAKLIEKSRARAIACLFFFSPLPFLAVMISPDVPLILFTFLSALLFYQAAQADPAQKNPKFFYYFVSGVLWGAAFLSKYFAVFVLPVFVLWFLLQKQFRFSKVLFAILAFMLGAAPFLYQHLRWNYDHCWANFVFNLVTRQKAYDGPLYQTFGLYFVYLLVHCTPVFWKDLLRGQKLNLEAGIEKINEVTNLRRFLFLMWALPVGLFGVTALLQKGQGLHWYLSYTPFFFMWIGLSFDETALEEKLKKMMKMTGALAALVMLALLLPEKTLGWYFKTHYPFDFKVAFHGEKLMEEVVPSIQDSRVVMADTYTLASVLNYELQHHFEKRNQAAPLVGVWGDGSRFGRVFDWTIPYRELEGARILIVSKGELPERWKSYFRELKPQRKNLADSISSAQFVITEGIGFRAHEFLTHTFKELVDIYYPYLLPGKCSLREETLN